MALAAVGAALALCPPAALASPWWPAPLEREDALLRLTGGTESGRVSAARDLATWRRGDPASRALANALRTERSQKVLAAIADAMIRRTDRESLPELREALLHTAYPAPLLRAVAALGESEDADLLARFLGRPAVEREVIAAFGQFGERSVPRLVAGLAHPVERRVAVRALAAIPAIAATRALVVALGNEDADARSTALASLADRGAVPDGVLMRFLSSQGLEDEVAGFSACRVLQTPECEGAALARLRAPEAVLDAREGALRYLAVVAADRATPFVRAAFAGQNREWSRRVGQMVFNDARIEWQRPLLDAMVEGEVLAQEAVVRLAPGRTAADLEHLEAQQRRALAAHRRVSAHATALAAALLMRREAAPLSASDRARAYAIVLRDPSPFESRAFVRALARDRSMLPWLARATRSERPATRALAGIAAALVGSEDAIRLLREALLRERDRVVVRDLLVGAAIARVPVPWVILSRWRDDAEVEPELIVAMRSAERTNESPSARTRARSHWASRREAADERTRANARWALGEHSGPDRGDAPRGLVWQGAATVRVAGSETGALWAPILLRILGFGA